MQRNALALVVLLIAGCHRDRPLPPAAAASAETRQIRHHGQGAEEAGIAGPADDDDDSGGGNGGGARYKDPIVYVDGEPRASFTYNEMPSQVQVLEHSYDDDESFTHRMLVCDYFHWLGADCSTLKSVQWYQGRGRVAIMRGDELRRYAKRLYFNFTKDLAGKPRVEWHGAPGMIISERPDLVASVALYVNKAPPTWSDEEWALVDDKGVPFESIPYAKEDGKRGVRVNVDGRFKARLKRNLLEGNVTPINSDKRDEPARYRLTDFLAAQKIKLDQVRGVDLVVRQERVVRVASADAADVQFTAVKQHHGEMMFYFGEHYVPALAVDVWSESDPPTRPMRTVTLGSAAADRGVDTQGPTSEVHARR
jgi:hypothetical protein